MNGGVNKIRSRIIKEGKRAESEKRNNERMEGRTRNEQWKE